jgi:glutamate synthase domain-containing protein 3
VDTLQQLIVQHGELTGSPLAKWILGNWDSMLPKFVKVFPHEYKRALGIPRAAVATESLPEKGSQPREVLRG